LVKQRLADEYGAAQERGEINSAGNPNSSKTEELPGVSGIDGLTHKDIHEARLIRDAEAASSPIQRAKKGPGSGERDGAENRGSF
jgi:hypothetical protein